MPALTVRRQSPTEHRDHGHVRGDDRHATSAAERPATGHGVSSIADNVIVLRYLEVNGHLDRATFVLKSRGTGHTTELRRFLIDDRGAHVGEPFNDLRGVLTGIPWPARAAAKKGRGR
jgi:KaiC/GvpD/RAD55 family RecA-like ATPase